MDITLAMLCMMGRLGFGNSNSRRGDVDTGLLFAGFLLLEPFRQGVIKEMSIKKW
jgi:hypothetical protein